jgi:hypothetical protein
MHLARWLAVSMLALVGACATTWNVETYEAPGSNLTARKTFAWMGGELGTVAAVNPSLARSTDQHVREAVVAELLRKGYTEAPDPKTADFLVRYQVAGSSKYVTEKQPRFSAPLPDDVLMESKPPPPAASELPREQLMRQGNVIVFVEDPGSGRLAWRGMISAETRASSKESAIHTAAEMARDIVAKFPARPGAH